MNKKTIMWLVIGAAAYFFLKNRAQAAQANGILPAGLAAAVPDTGQFGSVSQLLYGAGGTT